MATRDPIPPFPADIDRDAFGHYLSGFADGEACFYLGTQFLTRRVVPKPTPFLTFSICLRADDAEILHLIRAYLRCGNISCQSRPRLTRYRQMPKAQYNVASYHDLAEVVVPHFDRYPLRAKKARDFAIWRQGVLLCQRVRPARGRCTSGMHNCWSAEDLAEFRRLCDALRAQREYSGPAFGSAVVTSL